VAAAGGPEEDFGQPHYAHGDPDFEFAESEVPADRGDEGARDPQSATEPAARPAPTATRRARG
jgi:hypothetical protein